MRCILLAALLIVVVAGGWTSAARADGDPASDVLISRPLFLPSDVGVSAPRQAQLLRLLRTSRRAGFPIRIAVIPSGYDLGSVTALWHKPRVYARFLGTELSLVHRQPLLVVMPNGLGFAWPGHSTSSGYRLLSRISVKSGGAGLLTAAQAAVRALASGDGHPLAPASGPANQAADSRTTDSRAADAHVAAHGGGDATVVTIASVLAALAAAAAAWLAWQRRRRPATESPPATPSRRTVTSSLRRTVPGLAVLCCVGTGVPIVVLSLTRHTHGADGSSVSAVATPYTWGAGQRRAPGFRLTGENGRPISLAAYRGRPVIVTFVDPLCRDFCPLAAHVLNQVDRDLTAARRPVILAVSVDIYADSHADLAQDFRRWDLVPQWHWAVGAPRQLAEVWSRYRVGVSVKTKRIAGTTVHFITHDEVAFVIDPKGYVRALYGWPYEPQDVEAELKRLSDA